MNAMLLVVIPGSSGVNMNPGYLIGGIIALIIFGYLLYSLVKPDKF